MAAVGADAVLIGAYGDSTGANGAGAAYLFNTNGTLVTTFTKPTPEHDDKFGYAVASVGADKVLIGALRTGAAYVFSTNGTLLATLATPDGFGHTLAAVGTDQVLIGAEGNDTGATDAGAAYLFSLSTPHLAVERLTGGNVRVFWPLPTAGWVLESTSVLSTNAWNEVSVASYQTNATEISVTANPVNSPRFYRLRRP